MTYEESSIAIVNAHHAKSDSQKERDRIETHETSEKVYLDFNATTPLDTRVAESIARSLFDNWQNPSSQYRKGKECKALINEARKSIATMINANSPSDIVFVSGGTEANNLVFHSAIEHYNKCKEFAESRNKKVSRLPHIIISKIEHDSVKLIAEHYKKERIAEISEVGVNQHGRFSVSEVSSMIKPNTVLISIMLANNETGVIQPVKELAAELAKLGYNKDAAQSGLDRHCSLFLHTDAAQAIGKIKVDVEELNVDYLTIVGHKFYGPKIGALYARNCFENRVDNVMEGVKNVKKAPITHPFFGAGQENGLRPGTENTPMIVGLGKASELVTENLAKYWLHMKEVRDYLETRLIEEFGEENLKFNGVSSQSERLPNTCNVSFVASEQFKGFLILSNARLLEASTGACCHSGELRASKILLAMGIEKSVASNAVRLSVGRETTKSQVDLAIQDLKQSLKKILS